MFGLKKARQEREFRDLCRNFGNYFSPADIAYALKEARRGEESVGKLIAGVKAIQIDNPDYFKSEGNIRTGKFYGKGVLLLSAMYYKPGQRDNSAAIFNTVKEVYARKEKGIDEFLRQRFGGGSFNPDTQVEIE